MKVRLPQCAHRMLGFLAVVALFAACSEIGSADADDAASGEPPFFVADGNATGPLTLAELQIDIPDDVERWMTDSKRACFLNAVEQRAFEAGDPAEIDPEALPYWGGEVSRDEWSQHNNYMQRVLLAQAVISWAVMDC